MKVITTIASALGLFSMFVSSGQLNASEEKPNVEVFSGGGWVSAPTGVTSFDKVTTSARGHVQYWLFWEKINGVWTLLFRIRRVPPDPSVSKEEADTLNGCLNNKSNGQISVHHGNGGSSLEGATEFPGEITRDYGTIGK